MDMPTYVDEKNYTEKTHMSTGIIRIISVLSSSFFSQVRNPDGISEVQSLVENGFEERFICI